MSKEEVIMELQRLKRQAGFIGSSYAMGRASAYGKALELIGQMDEKFIQPKLED